MNSILRLNHLCGIQTDEKSIIKVVGRLEQIFHWSQVKNDSTMLFFSIYDVKLVVISIAHKKPAKAIIYENV